MASLPTGTVTFLFTDIEGSTRLLQDLGDRYASLIADHHRLLCSAFREHGGTEVQDHSGHPCLRSSVPTTSRAWQRFGRRYLRRRWPPRGQRGAP